ncbi:uncharacterized protein [Chironomus tepperi]|uniref:uncharacterized protein n=1 Tax=Chironomus tepperi TaxID=113505 RepID=UPI00391F87ED
MDQKDKAESLSACTLLFQLFGLQYFSLSSKNQLLPTSKLLMHKIIFGCVLLYVLIEIIGIAVVIKVEQKELTNDSKNSTKTQMSLLVHYGSYSFMTFVILTSALHAWFNSVKAMKIFNQLEKIQKIFEDKTGCVPKYDVFIKKFKTVTVLFLVLFGSMTVATLGFIYYHNKSTIFYWALLVVLPYFVMGVTYLRFCFYIEIININLQTVFDVLKRAFDLKQIMKVEEVQEFHADLMFITKPENETIFDTVVVLKRIYGLLYETSTWVNEVSGVSSILQILVFIIGNSSAGYKIFLISSGLMPIGRIAVPIYTMIFTYGTLAMIVVYACTCYDTSHALLSLLLQFEFNQYERQQQYAVSDVITEFASQMTQQPIKYTFCGYFNIERSFLAQIVLTILTYQIILTQLN